jgi:hypothetical protein
MCVAAHSPATRAGSVQQRDGGPKQKRDLEEGGAIMEFGVSPRGGSIDHTICSYLAKTGIGSARLQFDCSPCLANLWAAPAKQRRISRFSFPCEHHLPGDAGGLVGQRKAASLRLRSATSQRDVLPLR